MIAKPSFQSSSRFLTLICTFLLLCGCTSVVAGAGGLAVYNLLKDPEVNLVQKSNAAADTLHYRGNAYLVKDVTRILVSPLENVVQPGFSSAFSSLIPKYVGDRMRYLGYPVDLSAVSDGKINTANVNDPHMRLSGSYVYRPEDLQVDVHLYLLKLGSGRPVAEFDYTLPVNKELRKSLEVEPRIYRIDGDSL